MTRESFGRQEAGATAAGRRAKPQALGACAKRLAKLSENRRIGSRKSTCAARALKLLSRAGSLKTPVVSKAYTDPKGLILPVGSDSSATGREAKAGACAASEHFTRTMRRLLWRKKILRFPARAAPARGLTQSGRSAKKQDARSVSRVLSSDRRPKRFSSGLP